jgi:hypothetical protein
MFHVKRRPPEPKATGSIPVGRTNLLGFHARRVRLVRTESVPTDGETLQFTLHFWRVSPSLPDNRLAGDPVLARKGVF